MLGVKNQLWYVISIYSKTSVDTINVKPSKMSLLDLKRDRVIEESNNTDSELHLMVLCEKQK